MLRQRSSLPEGLKSTARPGDEALVRHPESRANSEETREKSEEDDVLGENNLSEKRYGSLCSLRHVKDHPCDVARSLPSSVQKGREASATSPYVRNSSVTSSCVVNPDVASPRVTSSRMTSPGLSSPCVTRAVTSTGWLIPFQMRAVESVKKKETGRRSLSCLHEESARTSFC